MDDISDLKELSIEEITKNLKNKILPKKPYTMCGEICIAYVLSNGLICTQINGQ